MEGQSISITINPYYIWALVKIIAGILLFRWEMKHRELRLHEMIRRLLFHVCVNPEWGLVKGMAAIPAYLIWGTRYGTAFFYKFLPIKRDDLPKPVCLACNDTGKIKEKGRRRECSCRVGTEWLKQFNSDMKRWEDK